MRITVFTLWAFGGLAVIADTPTITGVTAQQRYPWNGKVDISYTITGDIAATAKEKGLITSLKVSALDQVTGLNYAANMSALSGDMGLEAGNHKLVWDMDAEGFEFKSSNVVFTVSCEVTPALYCVIDLSAGAEALLYPVTYLTETPSSGFNVDEYKTTKLVLRRIEPGSFKMCGQYDVTLTKAYYMGVFEITQKQYELVTGNNPSQYKGDMRPVEYVSWNTIRGNSLNYNWPSTANVDLSTFIGKIRLFPVFRADRQAAQDGAFYLFGNDVKPVEIRRFDDGDYRKLRIPKEWKCEILAQLEEKCNVHQGTLFPELLSEYRGKLIGDAQRRINAETLIRTCGMRNSIRTNSAN